MVAAPLVVVGGFLCFTVVFAFIGVPMVLLGVWIVYRAWSWVLKDWFNRPVVYGDEGTYECEDLLGQPYDWDEAFKDLDKSL